MSTAVEGAGPTLASVQAQQAQSVKALQMVTGYFQQRYVPPSSSKIKA